MPDKNVMEENYTEKETLEQMRDHEDAILEGLLAASSYASSEERKIDIVRDGKHFFSFSIRPLSEQELVDIRKKYTKYTKNKRTGTRVAEEVDTAKFRSSVIYNSTVPRDKAKLWDNKAVQEGLSRQGRTIINALDVIEAVLLPGEKDAIMEAIDEFGGYGTEELQVETVKNS